MLAAFSILVTASIAAARQAAVDPAWRTVAVSVADLDEALALWVDAFGLDIIAGTSGADGELATLWRIAPGDIRRQALLGMPGAGAGRIHLVEFTEPGPPVREGAQPFDRCPKNLDVYVDDLPARMAQLKAAGRSFRNEEFSEVTAPDGTMFREIHMPSHDEINVVLLQVMGREMRFTASGFAAVGPLVAIVDDAAAERGFYGDVLGLPLVHDNLLAGAEVELMVGLPPGAVLDVSIWGGREEPLGLMEVIDYRGVTGADLYPVAVPTQRGLLHVTYASTDLDAVKARLDAAGILWSDAGRRSILPGSGRFIRLRSPAGLRIEIFQPDQS